MNKRQPDQIGYEIDRAYEMADRYQVESDNWHRWMDEAKKLETELRNWK